MRHRHRWHKSRGHGCRNHGWADHGRMRRLPSQVCLLHYHSLHMLQEMRVSQTFMRHPHPFVRYPHPFVRQPHAFLRHPHPFLRHPHPSLMHAHLMHAVLERWRRPSLRHPHEMLRHSPAPSRWCTRRTSHHGVTARAVRTGSTRPVHALVRKARQEMRSRWESHRRRHGRPVSGLAGCNGRSSGLNPGAGHRRRLRPCMGHGPSISHSQALRLVQTFRVAHHGCHFCILGWPNGSGSRTL